jgi:hypothetical protein
MFVGDFPTAMCEPAHTGNRTVAVTLRTPHIGEAADLERGSQMRKVMTAAIVSIGVLGGISGSARAQQQCQDLCSWNPFQPVCQFLCNCQENACMGGGFRSAIPPRGGTAQAYGGRGYFCVSPHQQRNMGVQYPPRIAML